MMKKKEGGKRRGREKVRVTFYALHSTFTPSPFPPGYVQKRLPRRVIFNFSPFVFSNLSLVPLFPYPKGPVREVAWHRQRKVISSAERGKTPACRESRVLVTSPRSYLSYRPSEISFTVQVILHQLDLFHLVSKGLTVPLQCTRLSSK